MTKLWGKSLTRNELLRNIGDISQLATAQPFELLDGNERGCRGVTLRNAAGLEIVVIAERGMGLTHVAFQGIPLGFLSTVGTAHPAYADHRGEGWLRNWPGGFLTPCGLTQVGSPCDDGGTELGLHGRVSNIPARNVHWGGKWEGDEYLLWVEGTVRETKVFGEDIVLTRRVHTTLGNPRFWVEDRVENQGFAPVPHMFLQHINLGFPLVDAATRLELPARQTEPRNEDAKPGLESCCEFQAPTAGYREQVFYHDLKADIKGQVEVRMTNPSFQGGRGLGLAIRYAKAEYPILTEWKMMGEQMYVVGIEPTNCHADGRCQERDHGTLVTLQPGESRTYKLEFEPKIG
jgi:hypothetical protein